MSLEKVLKKRSDHIHVQALGCLPTYSIAIMDMELDDEPLASYKWEAIQQNQWDTEIVEDASGNLVSMQLEYDRQRSKSAKERRVTESVRRGLIRYMVVAIDCSGSAAEKDYRPNRLTVVKDVLETFILEYFDQNPISQLCLASIADRTAEAVTELSGNPKSHINRLRQITYTDSLPSLFNTLQLAMDLLRHIPDYGHRELVIVYSSLSTTDPVGKETIEDQIQKMLANKVRVSIVCLSAEIYICKRIAEATGGSFSVATDARHLGELVKALITPSPEVQNFGPVSTDFIYMGFPRRVFDKNVSFGFDGKTPRVASTFYVCPRCHTKTTDIPTQCCCCTLQLNSSSHIARSHHHIFPVPNFEEIEPSSETQVCAGCCEEIGGGVRSRCPRCKEVFCVECDLFIHDNLHNCPACTVD